MTENLTLFYFLLPVVAFLYASVGHGGASGYLALMGLFGFASDEMKSTALILNIFVSAIAFFHFYRIGNFNLKLFLWLAVISVPLAFLGGGIKLEDDLYKKILGAFLVLAILKLLGVFDKKTSENDSLKEPNLYLALFLGGSIGFLSGLLGIGGGIILTPILLFLKWTTMKQTAGISAGFIFVNSVAGLFGQVSKGVEIHSDIYLFVVLAVAGGLLGGYLGSVKFNNLALRFLLAAVLAIAVVKLFLS